MSKGAQRGLSREQRQALLQRVAHRPDVPGRDAARKPVPDFTSLPGYQDLLLQQSVARALELENPFFRVHEERASTHTRIGGRRCVNFASYDYLGFNGRPEVALAANEAMARYGTSACASRVVAGERPIHLELEADLARLYGVDDCVVMVSGHATNVTTLGTILTPKDLVLHDAFIHNSIVTGAKLAGAERRSFPHNDYDALESLLDRHRDRFEKALIVVEGLYSMDGDVPDLPRLLDIKARHGCWLMVDEAHALGVLGRTGRGLAEHFSVDPRGVDIWMGTLSKTLASCGGYVAGPAPLIRYLKFFAAGFVYSVGMSPALAGAARGALRLLERESHRVARLQTNGRHFVEGARARGLDVGHGMGLAIAPVIVGDSLKAVAVSQDLLARGINALPIIHPAVPEHAARLRFFITADHVTDDLDRALDETRAALGCAQSGREQLARLAAQAARPT